jgi:hypothetical protein
VPDSLYRRVVRSGQGMSRLRMRLSNLGDLRNRCHAAVPATPMQGAVLAIVGAAPSLPT